jgi:hypothetical protein
MNREDILRMADEAYELAKKDLLNGDYLTTGFLAIRDIHFYRLATAAEREACAKACDQLSWKLNDDITKAAFTMAADTIRARGEK